MKKLSKKSKIIEQEVLQNYKINSPSKLPLENKSYLKEYFLKREKLFRDCLKLPKQIFKNKKILDFGSGTGEHDILYAKWGGILDLVEINPISVNQIKKYFKFFNLDKKINKIYNKSIFDFSAKNKYDMVISEGVLHHTNNPKLGFEKLIKNLKKDGFCVLQLAFDYSHFQRSLHRYIINYLLIDNAKSDVEEISNELFSETINRALKFGGRSKKQIIYDFYTNPKHKGINLQDIFKWFKNNNIKYYSSYPMIEPEGLINGLHTNVSNDFLSLFPSMTVFQSINFLLASLNDEIYLKNVIKDSKKNSSMWAKFMRSSNLDDIENKKHNFKKYDLLKGFNSYFKNLEKTLENRNNLQVNTIKKFTKEFNKLNKVLLTKDIDKIKLTINKFEILFKGYNGVPSNYIVGYKIK